LKKKPCHELVMGMTGSGKTVFSRGALLPAYQEKYVSVIVDTKHDRNDKLWNLADKTADELGPVKRFLEKGYHVHYHLKYNSEEDRWDKFDKLCELVMKSSGKIVTYVNEGGDVMSCIHMPFWYQEMLRKGRSPECWALVETQRPSTIIHNNLFNNVDSFWLFRMGTKDRDAVKRWFSKDELEQIASLPRYGYIWSDGFEYEAHEPLNMQELVKYERRHEAVEPKPDSGWRDYVGVSGVAASIGSTHERRPDRDGKGRGRGRRGKEISVRLE